jgi:threonine dehydrogenase-like Zn-dependent dehydrogenase
MEDFMKSAVFYGTGDLRLEDVPMPVAEDDEAIIEVMACGICGTDVHIFDGDKGAAEANPPRILGHEFSGIIKETGKNVHRFKVGDRVCIDPNFQCGICPNCRNGLGHYCENMIGYGTSSNGGFAQYCVVNQKQLYPINPDITFEEGAMAEPLACCLHGIDMCEIHPGDTVAVIGGGTIGLIMVQLARYMGASEIILMEPVETKRAIGLQLGATIGIDPIHENVPEVLKEHGIENIKTAIECVGNVKTIQQAIEIAGKKSIVMMFGLTKPDDTIAVRPFELFEKEIVLKSSFINPYTQQRAVDLINSHAINVDILLGGIVTLDRIEDILSNPNTRTSGKIIVSPNT